MKHKHSVYDTDAHFSINPFTRAIKNESTTKATVIQHDHNSERFTFELPRRVDGHDMSVCDRVEVHYINMDSTNPENISADIYEVDDLQVSPDDSGVVVCSWLLSQNATKYAGSLNFLVRFICLDEGKVAYAWHTAVFTGISVSNGILNNAEEIIEPFPDVLAQWKADLFGVGDTQEQRLLTVSAEQQAAIAAKGAEVLDSIPDEYEALQAQADENTRIKAGAIVLDAEGESIVVNDASDCHLYGLKLFGKSTQDGTPTPDAPVDIVSVENPVVGVYGKNLITSYVDTSKTQNGITFTVNEDGSITIDGTATEAALFNMVTLYETTPVIRPGAEYIISGANSVAAIQVYEWQGTWVQCASTSGEKRFTLSEDAKGVLIGYVINPNLTANNLTVRPMLRLASDTDITYKKGKAGQILELTRTLPGIPVASGGNYTDADGQQWICDEVDLKRGVYVQRVKRLVLDGSETWRKSDSYLYIDLTEHAIKGGKGFCSHFMFWYNYGGDCIFASEKWVHLGSTSSAKYDVDTWKEFLSGNNVTLLYILATPIETPMSDVEIAAFKALHSNKPVTTILNDAGAFMAVEYVADTKTYIDNKIKELMEGSE